MSLFFKYKYEISLFFLLILVAFSIYAFKYDRKIDFLKQSECETDKYLNRNYPKTKKDFDNEFIISFARGCIDPMKLEANFCEMIYGFTFNTNLNWNKEIFSHLRDQVNTYCPERKSVFERTIEKLSQ